MRQSRVAQISIFEKYSQHDFRMRLEQLSKILDRYPEILDLIEQDLIDSSCKKTGSNGLAVETIFRCLLLKQQLRCSYEQLASHLSDSSSYRAFTRLSDTVCPSRSGLQSVIRKITPETLEAIHKIIAVNLLKEGTITLEKIRVDSTVVKSNITPPSDSQLLGVSDKILKWQADVEHYRNLLVEVIDQTERRVINKTKVHSSEKIVSIFEEHTDIIVKGYREVLFGHKINLASDERGFITYLALEKGNSGDVERFMPIIHDHKKLLNALPKAVACDGGYASQENVTQGRELGIKHVVFHKRVGISYQAMGIKEKTFKILRNFRAGIEGNISELKRAFGAGRAEWKGEDGFKAFVWSSVITYNLVRLARLESG